MTPDDARNELINLLQVAGLQFDYYVLSRGERSETGVIIPVAPYTTVPRPDFLEEYENIVDDDMAARQFSMNPFMPIRISQSEYAESRATGQSIGVFLAESRIAHLLLIGIESSYGLAWITLYRRPGKDAFTDIDAEIARYVGQSGVYQWQRRMLPNKPPNPTPMQRYRMLDLRPRLLEYLFWKGRGYSHEDMHNSSFLMYSTLKDLQKELRDELARPGSIITGLNPKLLMELYLGKLPSWRPKRSAAVRL
jgi:hypothetical protein